ncbi:techylectin-5B-like [Palaemon carinicauda]|uniref:techylectin-5B-like n=1 Tax=Palaemon carinicauda TaxID=392227 RepID=UPI0035B67642
MEWSYLLYFLSTAVFATAFDSECPVDDNQICMTVMSNQMNITEMSGGMDEILSDLKIQLQRNSKDMKELMTILQRDTEEEASKFNELEKCKATNINKAEVKSSLETKKREVMKETQKKLEVREQLQREVDSLKEKKTATLQKIKCLTEQIGLRGTIIANLTVIDHIPLDCADLQIKGETKSGVYTIHPMQDDTTMKVRCDFDTEGGGWTVFLHREPRVNPVDFNLPWKSYKEGIGEASAEYFMSLDFLHKLTSYYPTSLRFDASTYTGETGYAEYHTFRVQDEENKYNVTIDGYQRDSTMKDNLLSNNNCSFTTKDVDNDQFSLGNCATYPNAAPGGWWYASCGHSRLTGALAHTKTWSSASVNKWDGIADSPVNLKTISLKFRRHNYKDLANVREPSP